MSKAQAHKTKKIKLTEIIGIAVIAVLLIAIISTFAIYAVFKDTNTAPNMFGYRVYIMNGEGMEPRIKQGAAVFVKEGLTPNEGNVILCNIDGRLAVVGYVGTQEVIGSDGTPETRYLVKYDKGSANEVWGIGQSDIIGVAKTYSSFFGGIVNFASSKTGMLLIVILPCALLMAYEIVMLVLGRKKKKDYDLSDSIMEEESDSDELELERLREEIRRSRVAAEKKSAEDSLESTKPFKTAFTSQNDDVLEFKSDKNPAVTIREAKTEEPTKPLSEIEKIEKEPTVDVTKISYSDIDELIKMLEEEKKRLENS